MSDHQPPLSKYASATANEATEALPERLRGDDKMGAALRWKQWNQAIHDENHPVAATVRCRMNHRRLGEVRIVDGTPVLALLSPTGDPPALIVLGETDEVGAQASDPVPPTLCPVHPTGDAREQIAAVRRELGHLSTVLV